MPAEAGLWTSGGHRDVWHDRVGTDNFLGEVGDHVMVKFVLNT